MNWLRRFSFGQRLALLLAAFAVGLASYGAWTVDAMRRVNVGGPLYNDIAVSEQLMADVNPPPLYIVESFLTCVQLTTVDGVYARGLLLERIRTLEKQYFDSHDRWQKAHLKRTMADLLLERAHAPALAFFERVNHAFLPSIYLNDRPASLRVLGDLALLYEVHRKYLDQVVVVAKQSAQEDESVAMAAVRAANRDQVLILMVSLAVVMGLAVLIHHSILQPLNQALDIANKVAGGEYEVPQQAPYADEAGRLLKALQEMGSSLQRSMGALQESRRVAEAASRAKSDFLANMSHEIRTPLNAIIGLSDLALKKDMAPTLQDYLQKIRHSGQHLLGVINDILDFSKIESGKLEVERVPFALQAVLDNVMDLIAEKSQAKGLELHCHVDPTVPALLLGDPLRIGQVLINYANNAVKFTKSGTVRLQVGLLQRSEQQVRLLFEVVDSGIGLTPEQCERLFQSFEQGDASTTREYGGTGLGLAICKSLAQAMGGEVGVASVHGQGSTFWFQVDLGLGAEQDMGTPVLQVQLQRIAGARILLVEDNEINQLVACELLRDVGMQVEVADNGQIAVARVAQRTAEQQAYDLVLMDMQMPVMDGITACRLIRQAHGAALPVVAMTANAMESDRERCLQAGMNDFITKPVRPDTLWRVLLEHVRGRPGLGDRPAPPAPLPVDANGSMELREALNQLQAVDTRLGLGNTAGNLSLYANLLNNFLTTQSQTLARIRRSVEQSDWAVAERMAHTLKGVSATLGASALSASAATLEQLLSQPAAQDLLEPALFEAEQRLGTVLVALQPLESLLGRAIEAAQSRQVPSPILLHTISELLAEDDARAAELWSAHAAVLKALVPNGELVDSSIRNFDFEQALQLLRPA